MEASFQNHINTTCCLLHRSFKLCSNFDVFHKEIDKLKTICESNSYPKSFADLCIIKYIYNVFIKKEVALTASKQDCISFFPFIVNKSLQLRTRLVNSIEKNINFENKNLKLFSSHLVNWVRCSVIKIPLRKRPALALFTNTHVVTARLLILVKNTTTRLLELQRIWVYQI